MTVDDSFTKSLLHFDGEDGSTTFTDESGRTWTRSGDAQIDTAQSVFGGASGLFDGNDRITADDHADWRLDDGSNSNKWTIDFRIRFNGDPSGVTQYFMGQYVDGSNSWYFGYVSSDNLYFTVRSGSTTPIVFVGFSWNPAGNTWYHIELVKDGANGYMCFVNGTQVGSTQTDTSVMPDLAASMTVGLWAGSAATGVIGWMDELRISKGVARHTANFTPPEYAYHGTYIQKVLGQAYASIKSVAGVAIAAIKSVGGV